METTLRGFITNGPYSDEYTIPEAKEFISQMKMEVAELKKTESEIRRKLNDIFKIEQPPSNDIVNMERVRISCMYDQTCTCMCKHVHACACMYKMYTYFQRIPRV